MFFFTVYLFGCQKTGLINQVPEKFVVAEKVAQAGGGGIYKSTMVVETTLPTHTIYVPNAVFDNTFDKKFPIVVWGNGGCSSQGDGYKYFLTEIASHGYIVVAVGTPTPNELRFREWHDMPESSLSIEERGQRAAPSFPGMLNVAVDWVITENYRPKSRYFGKFDILNIASMGTSCGGLQAISAGADPRFTTVVALNSGTWNFGKAAPGGGVATKDSLQYLKKNILYLSGSEIDVAYPNSVADFNYINHIPVVHAWRNNTPHESSFFEPSGGEYAEITIKWLDWHLKGKQSLKNVFIGKECDLCLNNSWNIRAKGF